MDIVVRLHFVIEEHHGAKCMYQQKSDKTTAIRTKIYLKNLQTLVKTLITKEGRV
jgi:hypothetical protein